LSHDKEVKERGDIIRAGLNVSFILVFLIGGLSLLQQNQDWTYLIWSIGGGIINGLLVGVLANGLLPYLEDLFDMEADLRVRLLMKYQYPELGKHYEFYQQLQQMKGVQARLPFDPKWHN